MPPNRRKGAGVRTARAGSGSSARGWFVAAVILLGLSTVALVSVVAGRAIHDGSGSGLAADATEGAAGTPAATTTEIGILPPSPTGSSPAVSSPTVQPGAILACGDLLVPIGKARAVAPDCAPPDLVALPDPMALFVDLPILLRKEAAAAMVEMLQAAGGEGFTIVARSAYRSYQDQVRTFDYWVSLLGEREAERQSARPGHSEHQLGTTADLTSASNGFELEGFEGTREGRWVAANAVRFGFVISYPADKEDITGYVYEPWHVRYVGKAIASQIAASGLTPIEFLERR